MLADLTHRVPLQCPYCSNPVALRRAGEEIATEAWCDVILRLRSVLDTISLHYAGRRVMIFTHQVVVLCLRYIIEEMDEAQILAIDRAGDVANCAITDYRYDPRAGKSGGLVLQRYNVTSPFAADATDVTTQPEALPGARG